MTFITEATLDGDRVAVVFGDAIVTATETLSLDEAPTLAVTVIDPDGDLVNSTLVKRLAVDDALPPVLAYGSRQYVLVEADKQPGRILALTFEQLEVYLLRLFHDYRKAVRGHISREMFAQSLCREAGVKFYAPEAGPPAPKYAPSSALPAPPSGAAAGFIAKVFINQAASTKDERDNLAVALDEAIRLGCTQDMMIGMVMAGTGESHWQRRSVNHYGAGHYGIFQQDPRFYTRPDAYDVKQATHEFLVGEHTWDIVHNVAISDTPTSGSFMALMKGFTGQSTSIGQIIWDRQRPGASTPPSYYQQFYTEATHTVAAYQSPGRKQNHTVLLKNDRYEFTRGLPGKPETSWDALGRLASEIGWRRFIVGDTVWFVADEWLFATKSIATITEGSGPVDDVAWIWDRGKPIDELDVSVDDTWIHAPGVVFTVDGQGPATGQWLLSEWSRDLLEPSGTLRLVKPGQTLPEPVGDQSGKGWKRSLSASGSGIPASYRVGTALIQPIPQGPFDQSQGPVHDTLGLAGYPAIDFFGRVDAPVLAVETGTIARFSGHDPSLPPPLGPHGPFGWSIYLLGASGTEYYYTHLGSRTCAVGERVQVGRQIATVGDYAHWGGSNHTHVGVHPGASGHPDINDLGSAPRAAAST